MNSDICLKGKNVGPVELKLIFMRWCFLIRVTPNQKEENMHLNSKKEGIKYLRFPVRARSQARDQRGLPLQPTSALTRITLQVPPVLWRCR